MAYKNVNGFIFNTINEVNQITLDSLDWELSSKYHSIICAEENKITLVKPANLP